MTGPRGPDMPADELKASFAPVVDARTRVLVLGSLPGEESLRLQRYYANPRNQFWRLMGAVIGEALDGDYAARLAALQSAGVGLWDCVAQARRRGSLDGAIRDVQPNALAALARRLPALRVVAFNGGRSAAIGRPRLAELEAAGLALIDLPSSSPALTWPFERKLERWTALSDHL